MIVKKGDKVQVEYEGTFDDGNVFDSTEKQNGKPLEFEVGKGKVIKGFDDSVIGMKKGEEKEIVIEPKQGYGDRNPRMIRKISRDKIPKEKKIKEGMLIALQSPEGAQLPGEIASITDEFVTLDLNHPLAGKTLHFKIKIKDVIASS